MADVAQIPDKVWRDENRRLRERLRQLLGQVRENEAKQERIHRFELRLMGASGLSGLLDSLLVDFRRESGLDSVRLALVDHDAELSALISEVLVDGPPAELSLLDPAMAMAAQLDRPYVGRFRESTHGRWFEGIEGLAGVALLPLWRGTQLIGRLHLGTTDPTRYGAGVGTYFLDRMAAITAVCLENALNVERLAESGLTDTLTSVRNRRYFDQRLDEELARAQRERHALACLFIDIDRFKQINDRWGHPVGDQVIREVARRVAGELRPSDLLARYGGEEFVVLLPRLDISEAQLIAERVRLAVVARPIGLSDGAELKATVSAGLASVCVPAAGDLELWGRELLVQADEALLAAKKAGRNRVLRAETRGAPAASRRSPPDG